MLGEKAPSFVAETTKGKINFPRDYTGQWVIFFSHPADYTPVCTTELVAFQSFQKDFSDLNAQLLGLSVDDVELHKSWIKDIADKIQFDGFENTMINFPIIDDSKKKISKLYGMLQPTTSESSTVRAVFIIDPEGIIRAILYYPQSTGRNIKEIKRLLMALKTTDEFGIVTPANWKPGKDVLVSPIQEMKLDDTENDGQMKCYDWFLCFKNLPASKIEEKITYS